jgi:hypothetical protein
VAIAGAGEARGTCADGAWRHCSQNLTGTDKLGRSSTNKVQEEKRLLPLTTTGDVDEGNSTGHRWFWWRSWTNGGRRRWDRTTEGDDASWWDQRDGDGGCGEHTVRSDRPGREEGMERQGRRRRRCEDKSDLDGENRRGEGERLRNISRNFTKLMARIFLEAVKLKNN